MSKPTAKPAQPAPATAPVIKIIPIPPTLTPVEPYRSDALGGRTICYHDDAGHCYSATRKPLGPIPQDAPTPPTAA
jgi:hypothetical protein